MSLLARKKRKASNTLADFNLLSSSISCAGDKKVKTHCLSLSCVKTAISFSAIFNVGNKACPLTLNASIVT